MKHYRCFKRGDIWD